METYIYLTIDDKKKLIDLARKNQLSLSTTARIIIDHYFYVANIEKKYIYKGEKLIHIRIRNHHGKEMNSMIATNAVGMYFHRELVKKEFNVKTLNTRIANELRTTEDPNANKNIEIRIAWRIQKGAY